MKLLKILAVTVFLSGLASCGGGGGSPAGTVAADASNNTQLPSRNRLFVVDDRHSAIATFSELVPNAGTMQGNVLSSSFGAGPGLAYDSRSDQLFVPIRIPGTIANKNGIAVLDQASTLTGAITPSRIIKPNIPDLYSISGIWLDKEHDTLYVAAELHSGGGIAVFEAASELTGDATPTRLLTDLPSGRFAVDTTRGVLYIEEEHISGRDFFAYHNLGALNGRIPFESRKRIRIENAFDIRGLAIDMARDRLYIADGSMRIRILDQASTKGSDDGLASSPLTSAPLILLPNSALTYSATLAFDPINDRLYAGFENMAYVINSASSLNASTTSANVLVTSAPNMSNISGFAFP